MTHEEQIAKLTEMLEIQQKLLETAIDMLKPAIEAEREECAKDCESMNSVEDYYGERIELFCAEAIRARGKA